MFHVELGWHQSDILGMTEPAQWLVNHYGADQVTVLPTVIECVNEADAVEIAMALQKYPAQPVPYGAGVPPRFTDSAVRRNAHLFEMAVRELVGMIEVYQEPEWFP